MRLPDHQGVMDYFSQRAAHAAQSLNAANVRVAMATAARCGSPLCCNPQSKASFDWPVAGWWPCERGLRAEECGDPPPQTTRCHEPEIPAGSHDRWEQRRQQGLPAMCHPPPPTLVAEGGASPGIWLPAPRGSFICQQNYTKLLQKKTKKTRISLKLGGRMRRGRNGQPI